MCHHPVTNQLVHLSWQQQSSTNRYAYAQNIYKNSKYRDKYERRNKPFSVRRLFQRACDRNDHRTRALALHSALYVQRSINKTAHTYIHKYTHTQRHSRGTDSGTAYRSTTSSFACGSYRSMASAAASYSAAVTGARRNSSCVTV